MKMTWHCMICIFAGFVFIMPSAANAQSAGNIWITGNPVLLPGMEDSFDEVAVKDPSIVYFEGSWHLFYTARGRNEYTTGYTCAKELAGLRVSQRHQLGNIRGKTTYGCAPQVFYFEPHKKWYLVFQNTDSNYQPAFSTNSDISDPLSWSDPAPLTEKDSKFKWIDFWIICDETNAYLFYTEDHNNVMVRSTSVSLFPKGWGGARIAFRGVHEAVHVYKVKGEPKYNMIYEVNKDGIRSFGLAVAGSLQGEWVKVTDSYASGKSLKYIGRTSPWTEMVSHGEAVRSGYDQMMEYEPAQSWWIVQGLLKSEMNVPYESLPWKLGFISRTGRAR